MPMLPDPQIVNLEITVAHQGKTIDELSSAVEEQWKLIDKLQKKLDALLASDRELRGRTRSH